MDPVRLWIDAVDSDVHVQVIGVVVHDAQPLVVREPERLAGTTLDRGEHIGARFLSDRKRQDHVIRAVPGALIPGLCALDLEHRARDVTADAVGEPDESQALSLAMAVRQVADEPAEAAARSRRCDLFRDHGSPLARNARPIMVRRLPWFSSMRRSADKIAWRTWPRWN